MIDIIYGVIIFAAVASLIFAYYDGKKKLARKQNTFVQNPYYVPIKMDGNYRCRILKHNDQSLCWVVDYDKYGITVARDVVMGSGSNTVDVDLHGRNRYTWKQFLKIFVGDYVHSPIISQYQLEKITMNQLRELNIEQADLVLSTGTQVDNQYEELTVNYTNEDGEFVIVETVEQSPFTKKQEEEIMMALYGRKS